MIELTPLHRDLGRIALKKKINDGKKRYRSDFKDSAHWSNLARKMGHRLPQWWLGPESKHMKRWLRKVGMTPKDCEIIFGRGWKLKDFGKLNPDWPLRAWVGLLLEYADELDNAKAVNDRHTHKIR